MLELLVIILLGVMGAYTNPVMEFWCLIILGIG